MFVKFVGSVNRKLNIMLFDFLEKVVGKSEMPTSKLNLKAQNINFKVLMKPQSTYNKTCVETACLGENGQVKSSLK
jgi:hypothetical protein